MVNRIPLPRDVTGSGLRCGPEVFYMLIRPVNTIIDCRHRVHVGSGAIKKGKASKYQPQLCPSCPVPSYPTDSTTSHGVVTWQLMGRLGTVEEVAALCVFLAADATFTTGVDHLITGGAEVGYGIKA